MTPTYRYRALVRRVVDGDTIDLDVDMGFRAWRMSERFRLAGINAPELRGESRAEGAAARAFVVGLLAPNAEVVIETAKDDAFGRWIATVWLSDGRCLNDVMVEAGHAIRRDYRG